jgi:hypothetical protein
LTSRSIFLSMGVIVLPPAPVEGSSAAEASVRDSMRADKLRRFLFWTLYLVALALAFEGASRLALSNTAFRERVSANDDPSWRLRWIAQHGAAGRLHYEIDEWHPARGWALKPNLRDVPIAGGKVLSSNSRGVRGRREHPDARAAGTKRILVLGDSFTFGEDVGDDETYSHQLEQLLPGTEVINLGVHGYAHDQMLLYLQEVIGHYRPDVVILGFLTGDMERNVLSFRDYAKPRFVLEDGKLALRNSPVPKPAETMARERWRSRFADVVSMLWLRYRWKSGAISEETRQLTLAILDEMKATIEAAGARPAYAYLPAYGEIDRADPGMTGPERFFFSHCRRRGIQSMYLRPYFIQAMKTGAVLKTYGHWGPLEHRIAAEGMRAYLVDKNLLSGNAAEADVERGP